MRRLGAGAIVAGLLGWLVVGAAAADPPRGGTTRPLALGRAIDAAFAPGTGQRLFILAIGSDARAGQAAAGTRADSLHIIGVDPQRRVASILGIPRDSYVPIPGVGTQKINASLFYGGPELTVRTVEQLTGIPIDGYLLVGFTDFRKSVRATGPLEVRIPYPMNDSFSGAHFRAGPARLNGDQALAFARNRHDAPGGDFGRSMNQGLLIISALRRLQDDVRNDPVAMFRWLAAARNYVRTDLSIDRMLDLLLAAMTIDPGRVRNRVVSGSGGTAGGASVIHLGSSAASMFRDLREDGVLGG
jgi:LCP family protein required for cell wall assembly